MKCQYCGKECKTKYSLSSHEKYFCKENKDRQNIKAGNFYTDHHKVPCQFCGRLFDVANIKRHESSGKCLLPGYKPKDKSQRTDFHCIFCNKEFKNLNSVRQHEIRCPENKERKDYNNLGNWSHNTLKGKTKETSEYVSKQVKTFTTRYKNGEINPHISKSHGFRSGWFKGIWCDSSWELAFLVYNLDKNIDVKRSNISIPYQFENKTHHYFPDFVIDNIYYEIKGRIKDTNEVKIQAAKDLGIELKVLYKKDIKPYIDYCINKYGDKFWEVLYDKN